MQRLYHVLSVKLFSLAEHTKTDANVGLMVKHIIQRLDGQAH